MKHNFLAASIIIVLVLTSFQTKTKNQIAINAQPTISFTFDDGSTSAMAGKSLEEWNGNLLQTLEDEALHAMFFVTTEGKNTAKGKYLLSSWNDAGHFLANHSHRHPNFNRSQNNSVVFESELLTADSLLSGYSNFKKYFRFPYLKEGGDKAKTDSIRRILEQHHYKNGHVTIDASDWYINSRLLKYMRKPVVDSSKVAAYKAYYIDHLLNRANYYESLSYSLHKRHINHTLLLHHNLAASLFLKALIAEFKKKGWQVIDVDQAYRDPVFQSKTKYAGESLIWAMAKDKHTNTHSLRYPAEGAQYEKEKMNKLGL